MKLKPVLSMLLNLLLVWGVWAAVQSESGSHSPSLLGEEVVETLEELFEEEGMPDSSFEGIAPPLCCELFEMTEARQLQTLECTTLHCPRGFLFGWRVPLRI